MDSIVVTWQQFMGMAMMLGEQFDIERMTDADLQNIQIRIHQPKDGGNLSIDLRDTENGNRLRKLRSRKT